MFDETGLEAYFAAARATAPEPSGDLLARIMGDAEAELAARARPAAAPARLPRRSLWQAFASAIGGWPALAGMVTATVTGAWIGFASPDSLNTLSGGLLLPESTSSTSYDLEELLPGYGTYVSGLDEEVQG